MLQYEEYNSIKEFYNEIDEYLDIIEELDFSLNESVTRNSKNIKLLDKLKNKLKKKKDLYQRTSLNKPDIAAKITNKGFSAGNNKKRTH